MYVYLAPSAGEVTVDSLGFHFPGVFHYDEDDGECEMFALQPLSVSVDEGIITSIDNTLQLKHDKEDSLRSVFQLARHVAQNEISELLADFRNKCALGE